MTKVQWRAIYDYCDEYGFDSLNDLLAVLRANGTVERDTTLSELGYYVNGKTYDDMYLFLEENI